MRVRVTVTVDIDPENWTINFGVEGQKEIRADVKTFVDTLVYTHMEEFALDRKKAEALREIEAKL